MKKAIKIKPLILGIVMSTIGFFNAIAQNQSNYNSPHGGKIKKVGTYFIEALSKDNKVYFFLLDDKKKAISNEKSTGSVQILLADGKTKTIVLTAVGVDGFLVNDALVTSYSKANVTFKVNSKIVSAKFSNELNKIDHYHEKKTKHYHEQSTEHSYK